MYYIVHRVKGLSAYLSRYTLFPCIFCEFFLVLNYF